MNQEKRILIAEDDPASRELLAEILRASGYQILEASNGAEAVALLLESHVDLAILDIQMPKFTGFEVLQQLRQVQQGKLLPVMAVTAHALLGDRERALASGFTDYLTKPLEIAYLRRRVIELLQVR